MNLYRPLPKYCPANLKFTVEIPWKAPFPPPERLSWLGLKENLGGSTCHDIPADKRFAGICSFNGLDVKVERTLRKSRNGLLLKNGSFFSRG